MYYLFADQYRSFRDQLLEAPEVDVGEWHAMDTSGNPALVTQELHAFFHTHIPRTVCGAQKAFHPNLPWAEDQFQERVSRSPSNPGNTYLEWPHQSQMGKHVQEIFTHTYMERYWPKFASRSGYKEEDNGDGLRLTALEGIRYTVGDLDDLVALLARSPLTRQAVLPVWFPEDTGAVHGGRVPCSLTYHLLLRDNKLNVTYSIRSCDFVRHFRDDIYMTARLVQWVLLQLVANHPGTLWADVRPGTLTFHCPSLHIMKGDIAKLRREQKDERSASLSSDSSR